jgi:hypothetical protein
MFSAKPAPVSVAALQRQLLAFTVDLAANRREYDVVVAEVGEAESAARAPRAG